MELPRHRGLIKTDTSFWNFMYRTRMGKRRGKGTRDTKLARRRIRAYVCIFTRVNMYRVRERRFRMATLIGQPFPANIENLYVFDKPFVGDDVFAGKRVIVISLPGAFTPV
jgi:hypothetical protein